MIMTEQGETGEAITILLVEDDAPTCWQLQHSAPGASARPRNCARTRSRSTGRCDAARCGATLNLSPDSSGTRVRLQLPQIFPDSDAAVG
jgi:hypothetical protein